MFGCCGKWSVNIAMAGCQTLYCCGYVYFICSNIHFVFLQVIGPTHEIVYTGVICGVCFTFLSWVRRVELFTATSIFGNIILFVTIFFVCFEGGRVITEGYHGKFKVGGGTDLIAASWG